MTSAIGNKGFTLIEVLVSVALLSVGLVWILEGYGSVLSAVQKARLLTEGTSLLQEKMADQELKIRTKTVLEGVESGAEAGWEWSTQINEIEKEKWYELKGEVRRTGSKGAFSVTTYVRAY